jgi:hypothetical protein
MNGSGIYAAKMLAMIGARWRKSVGEAGRSGGAAFFVWQFRDLP